MKTVVVQVIMPTACFGMIVVDGLVVDIAPIGRRHKGRKAVDVVLEYRRKGARFIQVEVIDG